MSNKADDMSKVKKLEKECDALNDRIDKIEHKLESAYHKLHNYYEWCVVKFSKINKLLKSIDRDYKELIIAERTLFKVRLKLTA